MTRPDARGTVTRYRMFLKTLIALSLGLACGPPPQTGPILFRADYADYPTLGFGSAETKAEGQRFTRQHLPTGGPQGQPAVRFAALHCPGCSDSGGQYNFGNRGNVVATDAADGESRFYRWRMRFTGNHRGLSWEEGQASGLQNKLLIVGQGCGRGCRFILAYQTEGNGVRNFRLQKDGGEDHADTGAYPNGRWLDIQIELATAAGKDGAYRLWINTNDRGKPTARRSGIVLSGRNHKYVWLGAFMNDGISKDGLHGYDVTDFEISQAFDPAWHR